MPLSVPTQRDLNENGDEANFIEREFKDENGFYVATINKQAIVTNGKTFEERLEGALDLYQKTLHNVEVIDSKVATH